MQPIADLLHAQLDSLLEAWSRGLAAGASVVGGRAPELEGHVAELLRRLIAALRGPTLPAAVEGEGERDARRLREGFDLAAVAREYGLLQRVLVDALEAAGASLSLREMLWLNERVLGAVAAAAAEHARRATVQASTDADAHRRAAAERELLLVEAEAARRAAEATSAEFEAMFNSLPDGAYLVGQHGARRANPAGLALLGIDTIEQLQKPPDEVGKLFEVRLGTTRAAGAPARPSSARALAGEVVREEYLIKHLSTGRDRRLRAIASPVRVDGVITAAVVLHTDITEQHSIVEALYRSEESFRTLAEAIPQQVWTSRPDGALDFVNQRVLDYFSTTEAEILGAGWQSVISPDDMPHVLARWIHSLTTGDPYEVEFRLRRPDGVYRWHLGRARAARDPRGAIVKWFGTNTDIDEAKRAREELEERTRFEQHLLGIVSHDLRNPLGAILLGATGLLEVGTLDEWTTKIARRIHSSAERSVRMVSDLLDFTQARLGGGIRLEKRAVDLHRLAVTAIDEVEATFAERTVELLQSGDTRGTWDADRIAQVVTNLVTNALKYSPPGTPVAVRAEGRDDRVELSIHNHGPPIPTERLGQIFEPLQRATDQIDVKTRSVGLGLYIVDAIVRAHGGTVGVVSSAGAGTTFTVRLPKERDASLPS